MKNQVLISLCVAAALLGACGQRSDTQATDSDTDSRVEPVDPAGGPANGTETVPGTPSTPGLPATPAHTPSDHTPSDDTPSDDATKSPSSDVPPSNPPQGGE